MDGGQGGINGRGGGSPEPFDLSSLRETLADPAPRTCQTPESFLGPTAASLVNLESLIPANPQPKNKNPFMAGMYCINNCRYSSRYAANTLYITFLVSLGSGFSAPSASNPFQAEQPKLSLNQMGSVVPSAAPHATSLPYSASLPLPVSHHGASIPSSLTHPTQPGLTLPGNLPEPLLPFSSTSTLGSQAAQSSQNPFLWDESKLEK